MDPITIFSGITSAISSADAATSLIERFKGKGKASASDLDELHNEIRRIKGDVLESKIQQMQVMEENMKLTKQIIDLKKWNVEKEKYDPVTVSPGVVVYVEKGGDPMDIWYCPFCLQNRKQLSFVVFVEAGMEESEIGYKCCTCPSSFMVNRGIHELREIYFRDNHISRLSQTSSGQAP